MKKIFGSFCFLLRRVLGMSSKVSKRADLREDFDTKTVRYWKNERGNAGMSDEDHDLIEAYSSLLERGKHIGRLSDLPAPKETIRDVLIRVKADPIYRLGLDALEVALLALDRFVPDEEYESAQKDMRKAMELFEQRDEEGFFELRKNVPPATQKAIDAYMQVILLSKKKQG